MGKSSLRTDARRLSPAAADHRFDPTEIDGSPHGVERQVRRVLTSHPGLSVSNLVVRRVRDGVCLTGVVESMDDQTDLCGLVRQVAGVSQVMNRLLVRSGASD
ncbi:MAG TPA: BON domain-containing protein [Planctomycetaceae bacterium]